MGTVLIQVVEWQWDVLGVTLRTVWGFWHEHGIFTASGIGISGVPLDKTPSELDVAHWHTQAMYGQMSLGRMSLCQHALCL